MANLAKADEVWTRFFREVSLFMRLLRALAELEKRFSRERIQVINENDFNSNFSAVTLTGVHYGTNTSEAGLLYVRVVANGGNWDVNLYTASGASGLVGKVTNVADSAQGTIVAQNSSGLAGTVTMGSATAEADDVHVLRVHVDYPYELIKLWPSDGTTEEDAKSRQAAGRTLADLASSVRSMKERVRQGLREFALTAQDNPIARGNKFTQTNVSTLISESVNTDADGAVTRLRGGWLEALSDAMADEATGSTQDILQRVTAATAGTFDSNNTGVGTVASHTPEQHCPVGRWTFRCVRGVDTSDLGAEEFDGDFVSTVAGDDRAFTFSGLRVAQSWKGPFGFGPITLVRTLSKTNDAGNAIWGASTTFTVTGETNDNTDNGVIYLKTTANGSNWDFAAYSASARATGDKVAEKLNVTSGATSQVMTSKNGSGLSVTFNAGGTESADSTVSISLQPFKSQNASNVPDKFDITTSETSAGKASRTLANELGYLLNGISVSPQIDDDLLAGANTFAPYIVEDT